MWNITWKMISYRIKQIVLSTLCCDTSLSSCPNQVLTSQDQRYVSLLLFMFYSFLFHAIADSTAQGLRSCQLDPNNLVPDYFAAAHNSQNRLTGVHCKKKKNTSDFWYEKPLRSYCHVHLDYQKNNNNKKSIFTVKLHEIESNKHTYLRNDRPHLQSLPLFLIYHSCSGASSVVLQLCPSPPWPPGLPQHVILVAACPTLSKSHFIISLALHLYFISSDTRSTV